MRTFQRISLILLMVMTLFLPFWLTFGRNLLGSYGWLSVSYLFFIAPILFVTMLIFNLLLWARRDVRQETKLSKTDSFLLLALYVFIFLHGFFVVDGRDTAESLNSVMTVSLNAQLVELSSLLSEVTYMVSLLLLGLCFIAFVYELVSKHPGSKKE